VPATLSTGARRTPYWFVRGCTAFQRRCAPLRAELDWRFQPWGKPTRSRPGGSERLSRLNTHRVQVHPEHFTAMKGDVRGMVPAERIGRHHKAARGQSEDVDMASPDRLTRDCARSLRNRHFYLEVRELSMRH